MDELPPAIPTVQEVAIGDLKGDSDEDSDDKEETTVAVAAAAIPTVQGVSIPPPQPKKKKKKRKPTIWEQASKRVIKVGGDIVGAAEKILGVTSEDSDRTHGVGWQKDAWWIGRRGRCLIGIACTEKSSTVTSKKIVTSIKLTNDSKSTRCEVNNRWLIISSNVLQSLMFDFSASSLWIPSSCLDCQGRYIGIFRSIRIST